MTKIFFVVRNYSAQFQSNSEELINTPESLSITGVENNMNIKTSIRNLMCLGAGVAMAFTATTAQADISWAAGAPDGTSGGSISFDEFVTSEPPGNGSENLLTGISGPGFLDGDFTVSMWLNADDISREQYAVGTTSQSLHLGLQNSAPFQGHWSNDLAGDTDVAIANNQWFHATFTFDSSTNEQTISINGVENASGTNGAPNNLNQILIGSRSNGSGDNGGNRELWEGEIDDVAFFTNVLTDTQIADLASNTTDALALGANAYYDFEDDQTGTTAAVQTAAGAASIGATTLTGIVAVAVPEPSSVAIMLGLGVAALARRKRS